MSDFSFQTNTIELRAIERALTAHIDELNTMAARQGFLPIDLAADRSASVALRNRILTERARHDQKRTHEQVADGVWVSRSKTPDPWPGLCAVTAGDVPDHEDDCA